MGKTNPALKLAEGNIQAIAKDIVENGGIGTNAKRMIEETARAIIEAQFLFNKFGRQLKGKGARSNILTYTTRRGWKELNKNAWREYGFNQAPSFLSENLKVDKAIETSIEWNLRDIEDTEKGMEKIVSILKDALIKELPVEYEKRFIALLNEAKAGKDLISDDILGNEKSYTKAFGKKIDVDISTNDKTKETVDKMIAFSNKFQKQENPLLYRPDKSKWMWVMNVDMETAINKAGGFDTFYGDESWERALNNKPFRVLNGIPVMVSNELYDDQPFFFIPRQGAFENIETFYTTLPSKFWTKEIPQGESATDYAYKIESDYFSMQISYWAIKMGLFGYGAMVNGVKELNIHFTENDIETGATKGKYTIDADGATTDYNIYLIDHNFIEIDKGNPTAIDGTETEIDLGKLSTGSYMLQIRDKEGFNLYTSATYYVRSKKVVEGTNQEQSATVDTNALKEAQEEIEALKAQLAEKDEKAKAKEEAKKQKEAEDKAKAEAKVAEAKAKEEAKKQKEAEDKAKAEAKVAEAKAKEEAKKQK